MPPSTQVSAIVRVLSGLSLLGIATMYRRESIFPSRHFSFGPQRVKPPVTPPFPNVPQSVPSAKFGSHVQAVVTRQGKLVLGLISLDSGYSMMLKLIAQKALIQLIIPKISRQGNSLYILRSIQSFMLKNKVFIFISFLENSLCRIPHLLVISYLLGITYCK